jgi:hypothetical protein
MRHCGYADERVPPRFGSMIRTPPPRRWRRDLFAHCVCLRWKLRAVGREPSQKTPLENTNDRHSASLHGASGPCGWRTATMALAVAPI